MQFLLSIRGTNISSGNELERAVYRYRGCVQPPGVLFFGEVYFRVKAPVFSGNGQQDWSAQCPAN